MTEQQFETRRQRAQRELFVISPAEDGWRVRTANNPSRYYLVSSGENGLACECPDFQENAPKDPAWKCKHVLAVEDYQAKTGANGAPEKYEEQERAAIQAGSEPAPLPAGGQPLAHMLVKRSLSPDGRIDSISIEFSFDLFQETGATITSRALNALKLQTEIVRRYLGSTKPPANSNGAHRANGDSGPGTAARMLDLGLAQTAYGEKFFVNFDVQGKRARFFGSDEQVLQVIAAAGEELPPDALEKGLMINLPCRVLTETNGKYLNVTQVLPILQRNSYGSRRS